jgi:hypothetical protein
MNEVDMLCVFVVGFMFPDMVRCCLSASVQDEGRYVPTCISKQLQASILHGYRLTIAVDGDAR